jgi:hypothetical protein
MSDGRGRHEWLQTGAIVAMTHNIHAGKGRQKQPLDFSPYQSQQKRKRLKVGLGILKTAFVDKNSDGLIAAVANAGAYEPKPKRKVPRPDQ